MRRNLLLARRFARDWPHAAILMLTEAREAGRFEFPETVDCISLPAVRKDADGVCRSRRLNVALADVVRMRSAVLDAALAEYAPDVLIVDHLPGGALGELGPSLRRVTRSGRTSVVLGMRDILDDAATVKAEWARAGHARTIERYFDEIWIYGDPGVFDPFADYGLPATVQAKARFTGYLNPFEDAHPGAAQDADSLASRLTGNEKMILCQVGGGQDGAGLAQAFVEADLPDGAVGVLLTGPFMARNDRERLAGRAERHGGRMTVLTLVAEPSELLANAERVITMGGYNSITELMALGKHALVVPRTRPRCEQLMRASRFARRGLLHVLEPEHLSPDALSDWIAAPMDVGPQLPVDMDGLGRVSRYLGEILSGLGAHEPGSLQAIRRRSSA
ncbi:MAG: glycosyltransferase family protein [Longimicrobiales bacterium]